MERIDDTQEFPLDLFRWLVEAHKIEQSMPHLGVYTTEGKLLINQGFHRLIATHQFIVLTCIKYGNTQVLVSSNSHLVVHCAVDFALFNRQRFADIIGMR